MAKALRALAPAAVVALGALPLALASPAFAASGGSSSFQANLHSLNGSGASGTAMVTVNGDQVTVKIDSSGLAAKLPHAQHIHIGGSHTCPSSSAKGKGVNGHLLVSDAAGDYGAIAVSLTTSGDTSPNSGLAVTRMPVGSASYSRTITVSSTVAQQIRNGEGVIVQHGVDYNSDGKYDGSAKSDLDKSLPEEATDPADCGVLVATQMATVPSGGAQTGAGGTAGVQDEGLLAVGGALILAAGGSVVLRRRASSRS